MPHTPLYGRHVELGAKLVDFAGWQMPLDYGSQLEEHHAVRRAAGLFDVSHMTLVDLEGEEAETLLASLLANEVAKLAEEGAALYSCMLRDDGGILDDVIAYRTGARHFRIVSNAATRRKDLEWMRGRAEGMDVELTERDDLALIAVQGPRALELVAAMSDAWGQTIAALRPFCAARVADMLVARTGYTGEDGCEIAAPAAAAPALWDRLVGLGAKPCGLGARDTLRLEAGLNLYGADMDEAMTPYECGLGWTVARTEQAFIGRAALERRRAAGFAVFRAGLLLSEPGVMRAGYEVVSEKGPGTITSGGYSPTLERSIAFARLPVGATGECRVSIRGRERAARIVKLPFVRAGKIVVNL